MNQFRQILSNTLIAITVNNFVWFSLVFWLYLETRSVIATSIIGASYFILSSISGIFFGTYVDNNSKKSALTVSTIASLFFFSVAGLLFYFLGGESLASLTNIYLYLFIFLIMAAAVAGGLRMITISTLVTILVPEKFHAMANGQVGVVNGISFAVTSVFSGLAIAYLGMGWSLLLAIIGTALVGLHLLFISIEEEKIVPHEEKPSVFDLKGSLKAVRKIPGLPGLIVFSMFNNFFGGVFMALADPYGLELVPVEVWGTIWGGLSVIFILGGVLVSKFGLTKNPLRLMFLATIVTWIAGMFFAIQESIILFIAGMIVYMLLIPFIEAAEQTVLQKVVPKEKQGRVFGFAQTVETLATPIMTLSIGPLAETVFIPFMTTGRGVELIGSWFGVGINRGIGLVFVISSFLGLIVTTCALRSRSYKVLSEKYKLG